MAGASSRMAPEVAVLMGGLSAEREVSLVSGRECAIALREAGYKVTEVDCGPDLPMRLAELRPNVCFNALHGRWGEDGCVQGILEWLRIPYTHSDVLRALAFESLVVATVARAAAVGKVVTPADSERAILASSRINAGLLAAAPTLRGVRHG